MRCRDQYPIDSLQSLAILETLAQPAREFHRGQAIRGQITRRYYVYFLSYEVE